MTVTRDLAADDLDDLFGFDSEPAGREPDPVIDPDVESAGDPHRIPAALRGWRSRLQAPKLAGLRRRGTSAGADLEATEFVDRAKGTHTQNWTTAAARAAVVAALACGPLALVFGGGSSSTPPPALPMHTASVDPAAQARASDLARQFVVTWLDAGQSDGDKLKPFVTASDALSLPPTPVFAASDPAIASIAKAPATSGNSGVPVYAVTVSVSVRSAGDTSSPSIRRYFHVPVAVSATGARALTLPAEVAAPDTALDVDLGYQSRPGLTDPVVTAAGSFLSAMLTGSGDVARYTSPGTHLSAITPPPYRSVDISEALSSVDPSATGADAGPPPDGDKVHLLITLAQKKTGDPDGVTGNYALTLTARGGRWEVSDLDSAPLASVSVPKPSESDSDSDSESQSATTDPAADTATPSPDSSGATSDDGSAGDTAQPDTQAPALQAAVQPTATAAAPPPPSEAPAPTAAPRPLLSPGDSDLGPPSGR